MEGDPRHLSIIVEDAHAAAVRELPSASPVSPIAESPVRFRQHGRGRSASRVSLDYFDPAGVQALERQMTQESARLRRQNPLSTPQLPLPAASAVTLSGEGAFDFQDAVRDVVRRTAEANIKQRTLGVGFRNLRVVGNGETTAFADTVGSLVDPHVLAQKFRNALNPPIRDILSGFEGVVRPGEMTLVLGRPGSGCTTFLKILANQRYQYSAVHGDVWYDAISPQELEKVYRGDVLYIEEDDIHFPTLKVGETLEFAAATRTPQRRPGDVPREQAIASAVKVAMTVLGLRHVYDTKVGDAAIRGVSGGEKKRVSIAEAMLSRAKLACWDNSTRGLDSSTALEFGRALRIATDTFEEATLVSLYQASESLYELFDKVCVIYEGRMAYFGPANRARQYFIDLGYEPANRQTTPDFLVSVTDPLSRIQRSGMLSAPRTAHEFAQAFVDSELGAANNAETVAYEREYVGSKEQALAYKESAEEEHAKTARNRSPYITSIPMQIRAVVQRRVRVIVGNAAFTLVNFVAFIIQGILMGTVFWHLDQNTDAFYSRGGVLFLVKIYSVFVALDEMPLLYAQRRIVHKQMRAAMYHPFIDAVAFTLVDMPISFLTLAPFSLIIYFFSGLQRTPEQYFTLLLFVFSTDVVMKAFFRAIAAYFRALSAAQAFGGLIFLLLASFSGYVIPRPSIVKGLRWLPWANPLRYSFEAIFANEFRTLKGRCSHIVPSGAGYEGISPENTVCAAVGAQPGEEFVSGSAFADIAYGFKSSNIWRNYGILIAFGAVFFAALLIFTERNTAMAVETAVTRFKRGSRAAAAPSIAPTNDQEKGKRTSPDASRSGQTTVAAGTPRSGSALDAGVKASEDAKDQNGSLQKKANVFSWRNVRYTIPVKDGEERVLLNDVSGYVTPGKLTALMGESGAGKTTLLNVLAQRVDTGVVTGEMVVGGRPLPADFQAQTGYCQQTDTHLPQPTVREALLFSAMLRQPSNVSLAEKEAYVDECLAMCGLEEYADAIVGTLGIEHRKRTTIGVELAAKPRLLLFLDEPTSGLDSQSAWAIAMMLKSLAAKGQAILCTVHQPSAELFESFDRVLLLQKGGKTVYFGDVGRNSATLLQYFERNGGRHCESTENPAEYMLDVIGAGATAEAKQDWHKLWLASEERHAVQDEITRFSEAAGGQNSTQETYSSQFATSWAFQVQQNVLRIATAYWRDADYVLSKLALSAIGGLMVGFTFYSSGDSQQGTQNKLFAIFVATYMAVPLSNLTQTPFIHIRDIYEIRERPSRMYSWTTLVAAQILVEIPLNILTSIIIFFTWYWTVGFDTDRAGFMAIAIMLAFPLYYQTFCQAIAAMSPSVEIAGLLFTLLFSFVLTFNGVMQPFRQLGWWQWMYHVSPFRYLIEALLGQAVGKQDINCSPVEFVTINPPAGQSCGVFLRPYMDASGGYVQDENATTACQFCSTRTTDELLARNFNIFYKYYWRDFGIVMAYVGVNIFLVFLLTYLFRIRKRR